MNAARELGRLVGAARVAAKPAPLRDFGGHDLGRPLCVVRPASTEHVRRVVLWARRGRVALTPLGSLTSFWASARAGGRVALDLRGMARLVSVDPLEGVARVEAGMTVAALDKALSRRGLTLAAAPDGFGDATAGSLAANDTTAGLGQFAGPASAQIVGLCVVTGAGEVLRTGASTALCGLPAFAREGLPDPTGLFLASEGTLGVVTELWLRAARAPRRAALALRPGGDARAFARLAAAARRLRGAGGVERFLYESWVTMRPDEARLELSGDDASALRAAAGRARAALAAEGLPEPEEAAVEQGAGRWQLRPRGKEGWHGVSLQLPHAAAPEVHGLWTTRLRGRVAGVASPEGFLRVYLNSAGCAALVGWSRPEGEAPAAASAALERELRGVLGPLGVPYRPGSVWRSALDGRLDPGYAALLRGVKRLLDPDGILNPGVGAVEVAQRGGR